MAALDGGRMDGSSLAEMTSANSAQQLADLRPATYLNTLRARLNAWRDR